jgi:hypothetical protein
MGSAGGNMEARQLSCDVGAMSEPTYTRLMQSIAANRLTILCGAGLSMAPPSRAPSAAAIAAHCADTYARLVGEGLPAGATRDLEGMSLWFRQQNRFVDLFIHTLVPWNKFNVPPNSGHEAIADFLACGAVSVAVTTNYDQLVEAAAAQLIGEPDFQAIVDIEDLPRNFEHSPFLKVHGCSAIGKSRLATIWCKEQLDDAPLKDRAERFRCFLEDRLLDRDVLIIGFWSDWAYLADLFATTIGTISPRSVILVDPEPADALQHKAPNMWQWAHREGIEFCHEQASGAEFLASFREHFSRVFIREVIDDAAGTYGSLFGTRPTGRSEPPDGHDGRVLYALRRDLTGVPRDRPVRARVPKVEFRVLAALHLRLLELGASYNAHTYTFRGEAVRLVHGAGQTMSEVKRRYESEPPLPLPAARVVCVGATPDFAPANVVREPEPGIVRSGRSGHWVTDREWLIQLMADNA